MKKPKIEEKYILGYYDDTIVGSRNSAVSLVKAKVSIEKNGLVWSSGRTYCKSKMCFKNLKTAKNYPLYLIEVEKVLFTAMYTLDDDDNYVLNLHYRDGSTLSKAEKEIDNLNVNTKFFGYSANENDIFLAATNDDDALKEGLDILKQDNAVAYYRIAATLSRQVINSTYPIKFYPKTKPIAENVNNTLKIRDAISTNSFYGWNTSNTPYNKTRLNLSEDRTLDCEGYYVFKVPSWFDLSNMTTMYDSYSKIDSVVNILSNDDDINKFLDEFKKRHPNITKYALTTSTNILKRKKSTKKGFFSSDTNDDKHRFAVTLPGKSPRKGLTSEEVFKLEMTSKLMLFSPVVFKFHNYQLNQNQANNLKVKLSIEELWDIIDDPKAFICSGSSLSSYITHTLKNPNVYSSSSMVNTNFELNILFDDILIKDKYTLGELMDIN